LDRGVGGEQGRGWCGSASMKDAMTEVGLYDYELPERLIAATPAQRRDGSRLLALERRTGHVAHLRFRDLAGLIRAGDLVVINDARVVGARLRARRGTGGRVEVLLLGRGRVEGDGNPWPVAGEAEECESFWLAMLSSSARLREGERLQLEQPVAGLELVERRGGGYWTVRFCDKGISVSEILRKGCVPLPPYILRARERRGLPREMPELDRERYQTVFANAPGAVAAPTAGLHFTKEMLDVLRGRGVLIATLTLLVGPGTFRPVKAERVEDHWIEPEFYRLPGETAEVVTSALREGRRVIATGTTCCRVLEYVARQDRWEEHSGWTDLFIYPPFEFKVIDGLITNFHLPRSTLLMLVCAFAGRQRVLSAYGEAMREGYRFYSYGDAMFIY